jgi:hypothetical protein
LENLIQYGPYSPQEMDRASKWLQSQSIPFEIIRNDQDAKEALMNDGQNLVNLADLRTGIYLAQIFYINLKNPTDEHKKLFEEKFTAQPEYFQRQPRLDGPTDEALVVKGSQRQHLKKRFWATLLFLFIMFEIIIALYRSYKRES